MERGDDVRWVSMQPGLVTGWCGLNPPIRRYLVVEALPGGGWDWVAWRGPADADVLSGEADTREAAMHEAERAASQLPRPWGA